jgi:uncharacterized membrane protein YdfJ with MMPL/SSD domain
MGQALSDFKSKMQSTQDKYKKDMET